MSKKQCAICLQSPSNLLILSCSHALCLKCSFRNIHQMTNNTNSLQNSLKRNMYYQLSNQQKFIIECPHNFCNQVTNISHQLHQQIKQSLGLDMTQNKLKYKLSPQSQLSQQMSHFRKSFNKLEDNQNEALNYLNKMRSQYLNKSRQSLNQNLHFDNNNQIIEEKNQSDYCQNDIQNQYKNVFEKCQKVDFSQNKKQKRSNIKFNNFSANIFCQDHPDYQVLYVCPAKVCLKMICPECVINGKHKTHSYLSFKKIMSQNLPQLLSQITNSLMEKTNQVEQQQAIQQNQFRSQIEEVEKLRKQTKKYYDQIKQRIKFEQKQAQAKCQQLQYKIKRQKQQKQIKIQQMRQQLQHQIFQLKQLKTQMQQAKSFLSQIYSTQKHLDSNHFNLFQLKKIQFQLIQQYLKLKKDNQQFNQKKDLHQIYQSNRQILLNRNFNSVLCKNKQIHQQDKNKTKKQTYLQSLQLSKKYQKSKMQKQFMFDSKEYFQTNVASKTKLKQQMSNNQDYSKIKQKYSQKQSELKNKSQQKFKQNSSQNLKTKQLKNQNNDNQKEKNINKSLICKEKDLSPINGLILTPQKLEQSQNNSLKNQKIENKIKIANRKLISQPLPIYISKSTLSSKQSNKENKNNKNNSFSKSRIKYLDQRDNQLLHKFKIF